MSESARVSRNAARATRSTRCCTAASMVSTTWLPYTVSRSVPIGCGASSSLNVYSMPSRPVLLTPTAPMRAAASRPSGYIRP